MCPDVYDADDMLEALCCANTHVKCSAATTSPYLISYDGSRFPMPNDASSVLSATYTRLCRMTMADRCSDCKQDTCSLFTADPKTKSCYGKTYTDHADGSGFHN